LLDPVGRRNGLYVVERTSGLNEGGMKGVEAFWTAKRPEEFPIKHKCDMWNDPPLQIPDAMFPVPLPRLILGRAVYTCTLGSRNLKEYSWKASRAMWLGQPFTDISTSTISSAGTATLSFQPPPSPNTIAYYRVGGHIPMNVR